MVARAAVGIDLGTTNTVVAWASLEGAAPAAVRVLDVPQLVTKGEVEPRALFPSVLYAPLAGEGVEDPFGDAPWALGEFARRRGAEVAGRLVASSKSWLVHTGVDRSAPILPWGSDDDAVRLSPVDAAARLLGHVRHAWDASHPEAPLADQDVVLTVPASFDEVARELTLQAAQRAGLSPKLLEEPQAAFYDWMARGGQAGLAATSSRPPEARRSCWWSTSEEAPRICPSCASRGSTAWSASPSALTCCSAGTTWTSRWRTSSSRVS